MRLDAGGPIPVRKLQLATAAALAACDDSSGISRVDRLRRATLEHIGPRRVGLHRLAAVRTLVREQLLAQQQQRYRC